MNAVERFHTIARPCDVSATLGLVRTRGADLGSAPRVFLRASLPVSSLEVAGGLAFLAAPDQPHHTAGIALDLRIDLSVISTAVVRPASPRGAVKRHRSLQPCSTRGRNFGRCQRQPLVVGSILAAPSTITPLHRQRSVGIARTECSVEGATERRDPPVSCRFRCSTCNLIGSPPGPKRVQLYRERIRLGCEFFG
jgi:hypothetical protein